MCRLSTLTLLRGVPSQVQSLVLQLQPAMTSKLPGLTADVHKRIFEDNNFHIVCSAELETQRGELTELEGGVDNTTQRISLAKNSLATLRTKAETLRNEASDLKKKGTKLQEANVEGQAFSYFIHMKDLIMSH